MCVNGKKNVLFRGDTLQGILVCSLARVVKQEASRT
jgi:hypothetical protein